MTHVSLTKSGSIKVDEFKVIRVGSLITSVKLNRAKQSRNYTFDSVRKSMLMPPVSMTCGV